jgi:hypothetical protein
MYHVAVEMQQHRIKTALSTGNMVRNARLLPFGRCHYTCKRLCNEIQIWNSPSTKVEPKNNIIGLERRTIQTINFKSRGFNSTRVCYTQNCPKYKVKDTTHSALLQIQDSICCQCYIIPIQNDAVKGCEIPIHWDFQS